MTRQKGCAATDPRGGAPRITAMMMQTDLLEFQGANRARPAYSGSGARKAARPERRGIVTDQAAETRLAGLVARVRRDQDRTAFAELFRHFAPRVKGFLMKSGADEGLAEECMQEVMATLWTKAHLYDPSRASVATWVFTIARNRRIDAIRRQRRAEPEDLTWGPEAEPSGDEVLALQQESSRLGAAIAALPEKQRELIERAYFGDLSHSEIAELTGLPLGTIKSRIRLALDRLRHAMGSDR
jgi:RNA polymerase sigma factor (sigma-70 family)